MVKHLRIMQETRVPSLGQEDPLEKKWQPTPVLLLGKSHGRRSLVSYSPWDCNESDTTERLHFHFHIPSIFGYFDTINPIKYKLLPYNIQISAVKLG